MGNYLLARRLNGKLFDRVLIFFISFLNSNLVINEMTANGIPSDAKSIGKVYSYNPNIVQSSATQMSISESAKSVIVL